MDGRFYFGIILFISISVAFDAAHLSAAVNAAHCKKEGVAVRNLTLVDRWYRKNEGDCSLLRQYYSFVVGPDDTVEIFQNMTCETPYCKDKLGYEDFRRIDENGNCRVRIILDCDLSDM